MWIAALLLFVAGDPEWLVLLGNGHEHRATAVEESADTVKLTFPEGTMQLATSDISAVVKVQSTAAEDAPLSVPITTATEQRVDLAGMTLSALLPEDYQRDTGTTRDVTTFRAENSQRVLRFTRQSNSAHDFWQQLGAVRHHHAITYPQYRPLGERFVLSREMRVWFLSFEYQKGEQRWTECQAFFIVDESVIVVSATAPRMDRAFDAEQVMLSIANSLKTS